MNWFHQFLPFVKKKTIRGQTTESRPPEPQWSVAFEIFGIVEAWDSQRSCCDCSLGGQIPKVERFWRLNRDQNPGVWDDLLKTKMACKKKIYTYMQVYVYLKTTICHMHTVFSGTKWLHWTKVEPTCRKGICFDLLVFVSLGAWNASSNILKSFNSIARDVWLTHDISPNLAHLSKEWPTSSFFWCHFQWNKQVIRILRGIVPWSSKRNTPTSFIPWTNWISVKSRTCKQFP